MREFFPRTPAEDDEPVDLALVRADDALIEALRGTPLFDEPTPAPASWLRLPGRISESGGDLDGADPDGPDPDTADLDGADPDTADPDTADLDTDFAAFARFADTGAESDAPILGDDDAQVAALLQAWRSELDSRPMPAPLDLQLATAIVRSAPRHRRSVRPMIAVAAAIAGLLLGSTAIGARSATPDNTLLWPVTQLLWGDQADQVLASIEAREGIDGAVKALDAGHPDQAEAALDRVTVVITKVQDSSDRRTLQSDLTRVQSQLESSRATTATPTSVGTTSAVPGIGTTSVNPSTLNPATPTPSSVTPTADTSTTPADDPTTDPVVPGTTPVSPDPSTPSDQVPLTPSDPVVPITPSDPVTTPGSVTVETTPPPDPVKTADAPPAGVAPGDNAGSAQTSVN